MARDRPSSLKDHDDSQSGMMGEMCLVVDMQDNVIGTLSKLDSHYMEGHRHRAFSVFLFDSEGRLLVQRRSSEKITFPGVWGNTCCSHPLDIEGENGDAEIGVINAAKRKLEHELGIPLSTTENWNFHHIGILEYACRWNSEWIEREMDHVLIVEGDTEIIPNENEISSVRWLDPDEVGGMLNGKGEWDKATVAPWFRLIWKHLVELDGFDARNLSNTKFENIKFCGEVDLEGQTVMPRQKLLDAMSAHRDRVEKEIMSSLGKTSQDSLQGAMTHLFKGGGKRLRAILPRLVGEAVGDANDGHFTLGASIEIIHNFTLIHDDIMDQDPIRRGLDAVHVAYDDATAICAGDAMLAVGFEILGNSQEISSDNLRPLIVYIGEMVRRVAEGQQDDIEFESRALVTEEEYIAMIAGKTSAMFETCARTGAILANADQDTVENMARWGMNLGLCFQLMDDLIDITGDTATLGKPSGSDIVQGKKTLVAIHAMGCDQELPYFNKVFGQGDCDAGDLAAAVEELRESGSIDYAKRRAMEHHALAHRCLDELEESEAVKVLRELTDYQLVRTN
jgi:geranylgeranyl diphosphate synthase type I